VGKILNKIQTGILLLLAAATPLVAVLDEKYWFEKRILLTGAAILLLALLAIRIWGQGGIKGVKGVKETGNLGWLLFGVALVVAGLVPAGRISNLMAPDLWAAAGAVVAYFTIRNTLTSAKQIKLGFGAALIGMLAAAGLAGIKGVKGINVDARGALEILQRSPVWGEFREFRTARLGVLQVAGGLGILGILGILGLGYQLVLKSAKEIFKSSSIWWKLLNLLVLVLLVAFLVLPHPALALWPLAVAAALTRGITTGEGYKGDKRDKGFKGTIEGAAWAGVVGLLVVVVLGSSYGLGRVAWGEIKFRQALAAANRNEGIATYYGLREAIKRNPYEVRYHLLASQIDLALANSIAATAGERGEQEEQEATESAQLTAQDQNNILILIQESVVEGKRAVQLDPKNSVLWQNLASIYRSLVGIASGAEDWALKCFEQAAELNPLDPNPPLQLGTIHFVSGNYQGAVEAFEEASKLKSDWPIAHYNLAVVFNAMGEADKAIEQLRETLALLPADSPDRERVEKDLEFLKGEGQKGLKGLKEEETTKTEELKEATTSAEVEAPPPPVGPGEATESAEMGE